MNQPPPYVPGPPQGPPAGYPAAPQQGAPPGYPAAPQQGAPPGYPAAPQQGYYQPPASTAVPADARAMFAGANEAKATFAKNYLNTETVTGPDGKPAVVPSPGDYVLELAQMEALNIPAVPGQQSYSGPAVSLTFKVLASSNPAHPAGQERSLFLKMEPKRIQNTLNSLRNLVVSLCGWDESRDAQAIAAWLGQRPNMLQETLVAMAENKDTLGGFKGRQCQATVRAAVAKNSGNAYGRVAFRPMA